MTNSARLDAPALRRQSEVRTPAKQRLKIMLLRVRLLYPQNTGGKIRTARMIEELSRDHDITMVTYRYPGDTDDDVRKTAACCQKLVTVPYSEAAKFSPRFFWELAKNLVSPLPYVVEKYASTQMSDTVRQIYLKEKPDLVMCDFLQSCEGVSAIPDVPFTLFQHNVEAAIFEQLADRASNFLSRAFLRMQARRMRAYEKEQCRRARRVIAVSDVDREAYSKEYGVTHCDVVPTGTDTAFFHPGKTQPATNNLVFTGSMDWLANQDAIQYFAADIFPLIRQEVPDTTFTIVGRNPPKEIVKLGETPGITVTGTVDDIRPYVHAAKVYVVPLRIGSGTRIKLLEALSMGKATVSTSIGAEGLPIAHNRNIILADDPKTFAREVVALLRDGRRRWELESNARELVEEGYSWRHVGRVFDDICRRAARK